MSPELHSLVGPYVLDALDADERRQFEEHLQRCPTCRADVAELIEVTAPLAEATAEPVPPSLRASVLSQVHHTRQDLPLPGVAPSRRLRRMLAAAAALVLVVASVVGVSSWRDANQRADRAESVLALVGAADAQSVELDSRIGSLQVVMSESHGSMVLLGEGVDPVPDDRTYELWFIGDEGPVSVGTFRPHDGRVTYRVEQVPTGTVGITEEPDGGSPQPTGDVIASAPV